MHEIFIYPEKLVTMLISEFNYELSCSKSKQTGFIIKLVQMSRKITEYHAKHKLSYITDRIKLVMIYLDKKN
jgi:hypothetical protein